jgi:hypothetical protein
MKKILMLGIAALVMNAAPAFAEEKAAGDTPSPHHKSNMMKEIDADGDGSVSKAEFLAFHEKRFGEMDTNSDGKISKEEHEAKKAEWKAKMKERRAKHAKKDAVEAPVEAPAETPAQAPAETPAEKPAE